MQKVLGFGALCGVSFGGYLYSQSNKQVSTSSGKILYEFGKTPKGEQAYLFNFKTSKMELEFTNYGATITKIIVPDRNNRKSDIALGYSAFMHYLSDTQNLGNIVGRYANRIANGEFKIGENTYELEKNNSPAGIPCHLHGGRQQFGKQLFDFEPVKNQKNEEGIKFSLLSPDGHGGYPGNLNFSVTYWLVNENSLRIDYEATTDKPTVINPANHTYFNLKGHGEGEISDHYVKIYSNQLVEVNEGLIPTGNLIPVKDTPFDFKKFKQITKDINDMTNLQIKYGSGYDHCFVIDKQVTYDGQLQEKLYKAAEVQEISSGRKLEVFTSEPGVQLYTGNFLGNQSRVKDHKKYGRRSGLCLETQHYPDSPNQKDFPSTLLNPGQTFKSSTIYRFGLI